MLALFLAGLALAASSSPPALTVSLELRDAWHAVVRLSNPTDSAVAFLEHGTPFASLVSSRDLFVVIDNTDPAAPERVPYAGILASYATPYADSYRTLLPGASLAADVDLSQSFQFRAGHTYSVAVGALRLHHAVDTTAEWLFPKGRLATTKEEAEAVLGSLAVATLASGAAEFVAPADTAMPHERAARERERLGTSYAVDAKTGQRRFGYTNCLATEQSQIQIAAPLVISGVTDVINNYLTPGCKGYDYVKLFGAYTAARWAEVNVTYANMLRLHQASNWVAYCNPSGCSAGVYAYVYPSDTATHTINLCSAFWTASNTIAQDSKPGTLVHESSHFNDIGATADNVYGYTGAVSLATTNPDQSVNNADTFEYFFEFPRACCDSAAAMGSCTECASVPGCQYCSATPTCARTLDTATTCAAGWATCATNTRSRTRTKSKRTRTRTRTKSKLTRTRTRTKSKRTRTRTRTKTRRTRTRTATVPFFTRTPTTQYVCGSVVPDGRTTMALLSQLGASYTNNVNCSFLVHSTAGCSIRGQFTSFSTESGYDFVRIYNGNSASSQQLLSASGSALPAAVTTTQPYMYITFLSDYSVVSSGWRLLITPVSCPATSTRTKTKRTRTKTKRTRTKTKLTRTKTKRTRTRSMRTPSRTAQSFVCGQVIPDGVSFARLAAVASGNYAKNINCAWVFNNSLAAPGCGLTFTLNSINSEADGDFVSVTSPAPNSLARLLYWSGTSLPSVRTVQSIGPALIVTFVGDNDLLVGTGFTATVAPYCPVPAVRTTYYMGEGVPTAALNAPFTLRNVAAGVVPKSTTTSWTLTHPSPLCRPTLTLTSFSSEANGDTMTVLSGTTGNMVVWSGSSLPAVTTLASRTNTMVVRFVTNAAVMSAGFVGTVSSVCTPQTFYVGDAVPADTYNSVVKVVEAGSYWGNLNATWTYTRTTPGCFGVTFTALNTEAGVDLVRVVDVATGTTLVTASGSAVPAGVFKSTGASLKVWFTSSATVHGAGFAATVLAVAC